MFLVISKKDAKLTIFALSCTCQLLYETDGWVVKTFRLICNAITPAKCDKTTYTSYFVHNKHYTHIQTHQQTHSEKYADNRQILTVHPACLQMWWMSPIPTPAMETIPTSSAL